MLVVRAASAAAHDNLETCGPQHVAQTGVEDFQGQVGSRTSGPRPALVRPRSGPDPACFRPGSVAES